MEEIMSRDNRVAFELNELLHPAQAFKHPRDVVEDPDLTLNEKRAILASWASDACAIEAAPELRQAPNGAHVRFDDIMDALRSLDRQAKEASGTSYRGLQHWRRKVRSFQRRNDPGSGQRLQ
jgi:hypothetical protein